MDTFRNLLHPEDADVTWAAVERHLQKRVPYNVEYRLRTKSGEFRWFLARGQAIWDSKGNATRITGSLQDITERVEAVQNLKDALSEIKKLKENLEAERAYFQEEIKLEHNFENIIGQSNDLNYVLYKVEQIATTDTTVLVLGETGTGKELVARAVHGSSTRKDRPLLKVNCATLPLNLIESELFGHERGAFTGAYARQLGRFEVANGATIFLDEIGELPLELQPKLLRVIQDGEFERLGSPQTIKVDVRDITQANQTGKRLLLALDNDNTYHGIEAVTSSTGVDIPTSNISGDAVGEDLVVYKSELSIKHATTQPAFADPSISPQEVYRFTVTADSAGPVDLGRLTLDFRMEGMRRQNSVFQAGDFEIYPVVGGAADTTQVVYSQISFPPVSWVGSEAVNLLDIEFQNQERGAIWLKRYRSLSTTSKKRILNLQIKGGAS